MSKREARILVTGATGGVGRHLISELLARSALIRAVERKLSDTKLPADVEVVRGDLADPASLDAALADTDSVFLIWPFFSLGNAFGVIDAIAKHARRVVYLSAEVAAKKPDSLWGALERRIEDSSLEWTFLRVTGLAKNTLGWRNQIRTGVVRAPSGQAARSLIDERDVAAVAVRALTEDGHKSKTYVLSGPAAVTQAEQVRIIGDAIGRPLRWEEQSREDARPGLVTMFGSESFADSALDTWAGFVAHPERVTADVHEITGVPAHSFTEWTVEHANDFR